MMTFYSESEKLLGIVDALRKQLPQTYEAIRGFRGLIVLDKPVSDHIIAVTLWDDEKALQASETHARAFAQQISRATGAEVSYSTYNVLGSIGIAPPPPLRSL